MYKGVQTKTLKRNGQNKAKAKKQKSCQKQ